jgi:predicted aconitase with swiveling domain
MEIRCHRIAPGRGEGEAMVTKERISFLGNVDPETGVVVDPRHELFGRCIAGKVLIFPGGKGSTVGSYVIYQLKKRGASPAAMVNIRSEPIVAVGAIISGIPLVDRVPEEILETGPGTWVAVDADKEILMISEEQAADGDEGHIEDLKK